MKLKTLIIDDEKRAREGLLSQLESPLKELDIVGEGKSVKDGIEKIHNLNPDLVFLDIELGDGTGFDLLKKVEKDFQVVFVTAYDQYAIQAIKFSALDYLLKPIDPDELNGVIERALKNHGQEDRLEQIENLLRNSDLNNPNERKLAVKCIDSIKYIPIDDLSHFMADGSYTKICTTDGKSIIASKMLKHFADMLSDFSQFMRIHRSTLINLNYVREFQYGEGGSILMTNGDKVYPSDDRKKELLKQLEKLN